MPIWGMHFCNTQRMTKLRFFHEAWDQGRLQIQGWFTWLLTHASYDTMRVAHARHELACVTWQLRSLSCMLYSMTCWGYIASLLWCYRSPSATAMSVVNRLERLSCPTENNSYSYMGGVPYVAFALGTLKDANLVEFDVSTLWYREIQRTTSMLVKCTSKKRSRWWIPEGVCLFEGDVHKSLSTSPCPYCEDEEEYR